MWGLEEAKVFEFGSGMVACACSPDGDEAEDHEFEDGLGRIARSCLKGKEHKPCNMLTLNKVSTVVFSAVKQLKGFPRCLIACGCGQHGLSPLENHKALVSSLPSNTDFWCLFTFSG